MDKFNFTLCLHSVCFTELHSMRITRTMVTVKLILNASRKSNLNITVIEIFDTDWTLTSTDAPSIYIYMYAICSYDKLTLKLIYFGVLNNFSN